MSQSEVILKVGGEGGDITLYGARTSTGWRFSRRTIDQTAMLLFDEPAIEDESVMVEAWDDALRLVDRYPWHLLYPLEVHPEFRERVWFEVERRCSDRRHRLERWREVCGS